MLWFNLKINAVSRVPGACDTFECCACVRLIPAQCSQAHYAFEKTLTGQVKELKHDKAGLLAGSPTA